MQVSTPTSEQGPSFWADVREAVRGSEQDFTQGSISRAITLLAIPMVLEMAMESVFAVVDVFFVAGLGADAVAAVGIAESLLTLVYAAAIGLSMGTTAMIARRIGEKDKDAAAVVAVQAIVLGLLVSVAIGVAGALLAPRLLTLMGATPEVAAVGTGYTTWMLGGSLTVFQLFLINAVFRGAGDAAIAMRVLWLANGINIVLDPCLIYGWGPFPELGVTGAAVATNIGRGFGVLYQLYELFGGKGRIAVRRSHLKAAPVVMTGLLRISIPGMFQYFVAVASWIGLVRIIALFGSEALAGYTIALRIVTFSILPSWGVSNAAATLVGQNLGAGKPDRAERSVWLTGVYNMIFLGAVGLVFMLFAGPLIGIFTSDATVIATGTDCLRIISYGYALYAFGMVIVQAFNGAGDTVTPTIINLICYWLWEIPLAWVLAMPLGMGTGGVFWAVTIAECTLAVAGMAVFRRGKWKQAKA